MQQYVVLTRPASSMSFVSRTWLRRSNTCCLYEAYMITGTKIPNINTNFQPYKIDMIKAHVIVTTDTST